MEEHKTKKGKKKSKSSNLYTETSPQQIVAKPTIVDKVLRRSQNGNDLYTMLISVDNPVNTDGSGNNALVIPVTGTNLANWANLKLVFDEFRVLAWRVVFYPTKISGGSSVSLQAPIFSVLDYDSATPLNSTALANKYASCRIHAPDKRFERTYIMSGAENAQFITTLGTLPVYGYIKLWTTLNSASINLGQAMSYAVIQFRQRAL